LSASKVGKPHHTAKAALHSPHPVHGFGIDPAHGGIEHDAPEHLEAGDVLAREPCAIGGGGDMVLEHQRLEAPLLLLMVPSAIARMVLPSAFTT
jgi:hypothetical protein